MIYTVFMVVAIIGSLLVNNRVNTAGNRVISDQPIKLEIKKKRYCCFMGALLFLIAALRSRSVGLDTGQYFRLFNTVGRLDWNSILQIETSEYGFYFFMKLVTLVTDNAHWFLAFVGLIYAIAVTLFIWKNSKEYAISFIMLISFSYFAFSLTGIRQTVAIAVVLLSFEYVKRRNFWLYLLFIVIASAFHRSALLALPIYFLYGFKMTPARRILFLISIPIIYVVRYQIIIFFQRWIYSEYEINQTQAHIWATVAVLFLTWVVYVFFVGSSSTQPREELDFYEDQYATQKSKIINPSSTGKIEAIYLVGVIIQLFVPFEPNIFRLGMYYQMFGLLLVPEIIQSDRITGSSRLLVRAVYVGLMFIMYYGFTYYAAAANPYHFLWQI